MRSYRKERGDLYMVFLRNMKNKGVVICVNDEIAADYLGTKEWETSTADEYEATFKRKSHMRNGKQDKEVKPHADI